ncbi:hypothetical protein QBC35DRAFT_424330 [Podospora australis]|uniref:DUF7704 domain-containing protein n=1 Tax=Podospora australis TaxID=1536484 RepID=A0AAN6X2B5_9PEZI|nr:hypothetical protein QBC35DRAFT_424330 [Podospora australis]
MTSQLPAFPRFIFTVYEPITLIGGAIGGIFTPQYFVTEQTPTHIAAAYRWPEQSLLVTQQLGNMYFLAFLLGVLVLHATTEIKVVRAYLVALAIADVTHVGITCATLGLGNSLNVAGWNPVTWGNIGITTSLFVTRMAYFLGLFGPDGRKDLEHLKSS